MKTTNEIAQAAWDEIEAIQMVHSVCEWDDECLAIITKAIEAGEAMMPRHLHENAARLLIESFLKTELGTKDLPEYTIEKQGDFSHESHIWAFWILYDDTTSYIGEDGRIQWYGTAWEPEIEAAQEQGEPVAIAECETIHGNMCLFLTRTRYGEQTLKDGDKLYTAPPKRQPLPLDKLRELAELNSDYDDFDSFVAMVRSVEAAINGGGA